MALLGALNVGTIAVNAVLDTASLSSGMKSVQTSMDSLSQKNSEWPEQNGKHVY